MKFIPLLIFVLVPVSLFGLYGLSYNSYSLESFDNGLYGNPAGLNCISQHGIAFMGNNEGDNFYNFNLSYAQRFSQFTTGLNLSYKYSQEFDNLNGNGDLIDTFRYNDINVNLAVASSADFINLPDLYYGLRLHFENENAKDYTGQSAMADVGLLYNLMFLKSKYLDQIGFCVTFDNLGKSINNINTVNSIYGLLFYIPLIKDATHILTGFSMKEYFNSSLNDNNIYVFSLGFKQALSKIFQDLRGYNFMINIAYNYSSLNKTIGDISGLEYGLLIENQYFGLGYDCLFNNLVGNSYYFSLNIKF